MTRNSIDDNLKASVNNFNTYPRINVIIPSL